MNTITIYRLSVPSGAKCLFVANAILTLTEIIHFIIADYADVQEDLSIADETDDDYWSSKC